MSSKMPFFLRSGKTMENGKSIIAHIFICSSRPEKKNAFHSFILSSRCEVAIIRVWFIFTGRPRLYRVVWCSVPVHARHRIVHTVIKIELQIYYHCHAYSVVWCAIRTQACQCRTYEPTEAMHELEPTNNSCDVTVELAIRDSHKIWRHSTTHTQTQLYVGPRAYKVTIGHRAHIYSRKQTVQRYTCLHCINSASYTWTRAIACEQYRK